MNFFESSEFAPFQDLLDGELKRLNATGNYVHKKKADTQKKQKLESIPASLLFGLA